MTAVHTPQGLSVAPKIVILWTQLTMGYDGVQRVTKQDGRIQLESRSGRSWHRYDDPLVQAVDCPKDELPSALPLPVYARSVVLVKYIQDGKKVVVK